MKFELREPQYNFENRIDYLELYVTKNEFIKLFEISKEQCHKEFSTCVEMYTSPCCFESYPEIEFIETIYDKLKSKSKLKGVILGVQEIKDYSINKLGRSTRHLYCAVV